MILLFILQYLTLQTSFDDLYDDLSKNGILYSGRTYSSRKTYSNTKLHIKNCFFQDIVTNKINYIKQDGGAIYYKYENGNILIEYTVFYNIQNQSGGYGGSIC